MSSAPAPRLFTFVGAASGAWQVADTRPVVGEPLPRVTALSVVAADAAIDDAAAGWRLPAEAGARETTSDGQVDGLPAAG